MKKLTCLLGLLLCVGTISASNFLGVRASLDVTVPSDYTEDHVATDMFDPGAGFDVGVVYNIGLLSNFYIEPGVSFFLNTYAPSEVGELMNMSNFTQTGLSIPVMFGYNLHVGSITISPFTGPEFRYGFSFKGKADIWDFDGGDDWGKSSKGALSYDLYGDDDDSLHRAELKWRLGVGFTFFRKVYAAVGYSFGCTNLAKSYDDGFYRYHPSFRTGNFLVTVGYNF